MSFIEMDEVLEKLSPTPKLPEGYTEEGEVLFYGETIIAHTKHGKLVIRLMLPQYHWPALAIWLQRRVSK